ncbi:MAG: hypothetical protein HFG72_11890 [Hungatella sp.]|jgi:hypothetical protein|nr:hypothetical protein [Hungatella sp.]
MKLRDAYIICKRNKEIIYKIKPEAIGGFVRGNRNHNILITRDMENALKDLERIPCLKDILDKFITLKNTNNANSFSVSNYDDFKNKKECLITSMDTIIKLYESMNIDTNERIGLSIKLPLINDLTDFKNYISDLEFIFNKSPFSKTENEYFKFKSIDVGSIWIELIVVGVAISGGSFLLNNIAAFIDKCIIIRSHLLTMKKQEAELEKSELENSEREDIFKGIKKLYDIAVKNTIHDLEQSTGYTIKDGEEIERAKQAIEKTVQLLEKGLEIYSTIDSPQEIKALFEPLEMKYISISNEIKLLNDSKLKES